MSDLKFLEHDKMKNALKVIVSNALIERHIQYKQIFQKSTLVAGTTASRNVYM